MRGFTLGDEVFIGSAGPFYVVQVDRMKQTARVCTSLQWTTGEQAAEVARTGKDWPWTKLRMEYHGSGDEERSMPLKPGKKNIGRNIATEERAGKPPKQAIAIAESVARRGKGKKR